MQQFPSWLSIKGSSSIKLEAFLVEDIRDNLSVELWWQEMEEMQKMELTSQLFQMKPHLRAKIDHHSPHRGSHCRHSASPATSENNNLKLSWGKSQIKEILYGKPGYKNALLLLEIVLTNQKLFTCWKPHTTSAQLLGKVTIAEKYVQPKVQWCREKRKKTQGAPCSLKQLVTGLSSSEKPHKGITSLRSSCIQGGNGVASTSWRFVKFHDSFKQSLSCFLVLRRSCQLYSNIIKYPVLYPYVRPSQHPPQYQPSPGQSSGKNMCSLPSQTISCPVQ